MISDVPSSRQHAWDAWGDVMGLLRGSCLLKKFSTAGIRQFVQAFPSWFQLHSWHKSHKQCQELQLQIWGLGLWSTSILSKLAAKRQKFRVLEQLQFNPRFWGQQATSLLRSCAQENRSCLLCHHFGRASFVLGAVFVMQIPRALRWTLMVLQPQANSTHGFLQRSKMHRSETSALGWNNSRSFAEVVGLRAKWSHSPLLRIRQLGMLLMSRLAMIGSINSQRATSRRLTGL